MKTKETQIQLDDFIESPKNYIKSLHNEEINSIILIDEDEKSYAITSYQSYKKGKSYSKNTQDCCNNSNNKWETIGFYAVIIVVIISANFGK